MRYFFSQVCRTLAKVCGRGPPTFSVPRCFSKALLYPIHLARTAAGDWNFVWDPSVVDVVASHRAYDIEKPTTELGYTLSYSPEDGLREAVDWCGMNGLIR